MNAPPSVHIRWMIQRDMPTVLEIEYLCFQNPWNHDRFIKEFKNSRNIGMVAELNEVVIGYMIYSINREIINVLNLAVVPRMQRKGIGTAMISKLVGKLYSQERLKLSLEVQEENLDAQLFLKECGFVAVRTIKNESSNNTYLFEYLK